MLERSRKRRRYELPCVGDASVSERAKDSTFVHKIVKNRSILHHWFARAVYDTYLDAKKILEDPMHQDVNLQLCGEVFTINRNHLEHISTSVKAAADLSEKACVPNIRGVLSNEGIMKDELTFSATFVRLLDRFIFPNDCMSKGAFYHQYPSRKRITNVERSDGTCIRLGTSGLPLEPVLSFDVKMLDFNGACRESSLYSINSINVGNCSKSRTVVIGLPCTPNECSLRVCIPVHKVLMEMEVLKEAPHNKALLCTLFAAIRFLLNNPIVATVSEQNMEIPIPFKDDADQYVPLHLHSNCRIFRCSTKVFKLYDKLMEVFDHNFEVVKAVEGLPELDIEWLTADERISLISYKYIEGDHVPHSVDQFINIMSTLHQLHTLGYVHGDVRPANLVFTESEGYLIDYDLARKEGTPYPESYQRIESYRRIDAVATRKMKKIHDRFSLAKVISNFFPESTALCALLNNEDIELSACIDYIRNV